MTYPTQFPEWLKLAAQDGRGGLGAQPPTIVRGQTRTFFLNLEPHPVYGTWTGGAFAADLRASPDAGGAALATFTVTVGSFADGVTAVTFSLAGAAHGGIPIDSNSDGVTEVMMQVDYTPSGGVAEAILQTRVLFVGNV